MADAPRQPRPDLTGDIPAAETMGFFELLRRLEQGDHRFGRIGGPGREPARLGQRVRMAFATRDIAGFHPATDKVPSRVDVEVIGLLGPEGALPLHITRWVMSRLSDRWFAGADTDATSDTTFLDFCNLLQHRMMALYWRAWGDARPEVQIEHGGGGGRVQAVLNALAGVGLPGSQTGGGVDLRLKLRHATSLGHQVQGVERLAAYLADVVQAPVKLVEFVGSWISVPPRLQTRLGAAHALLGQSAVAGARSYSRQSRVELQIGPLSLPDYRRFLDSPAVSDSLRHAIRHAVGHELEVDVALVLARDAIPDARLGAAQLGRTGWLAPRREADAMDLRLSDITRSAHTPAVAA